MQRALLRSSSNTSMPLGVVDQLRWPSSGASSNCDWSRVNRSWMLGAERVMTSQPWLAWLVPADVQSASTPRNRWCQSRYAGTARCRALRFRGQARSSFHLNRRALTDAAPRERSSMLLTRSALSPRCPGCSSQVVAYRSSSRIGRDCSWEGLLLEGSDPNLSAVIWRSRFNTFQQPRIGRRLRTLLLQSGFIEVSIQAVAAVITDFKAVDSNFEIEKAASGAAKAGTVSREEAERWLTELRDADREGWFLCSVLSFRAAAQKPT